MREQIRVLVFKALKRSQVGRVAVLKIDTHDTILTQQFVIVREPENVFME